MRSKIKLLMTRRPGVTDAMLEAALAREIDAIAATSPTPLAVTRAYAITDEDLYRTAAGAFDGADRPFDTLMDLACDGAVPPADLAKLLDGLGERLADLVDPAASSALAGTEHVILPGHGPLLVTIANRRLPDYTHEGFIRYWVDYHGPFAREHTPPDAGLYYRQYHTDEAATARLSAGTGFPIADFDGAAECYYPDEAAVRRLMTNDEVVDRATEDEKEFVDHARCVTCVMTISPTSDGHIVPE